MRVDLFLKDSGEPIGIITLREGDGVDFDGFDPEDEHEARVRKMFDDPLGDPEGAVTQYGEPPGEPPATRPVLARMVPSDPALTRWSRLQVRVQSAGLTEAFLGA